jgi:Ricin-type beta-trefoil lectin domain
LSGSCNLDDDWRSPDVAKRHSGALAEPAAPGAVARPAAQHGQIRLLAIGKGTVEPRRGRPRPEARELHVGRGGVVGPEVNQPANGTPGRNMTVTPRFSRSVFTAMKATVAVVAVLTIISSAAASARAAVLTHPVTQQCLDANIHQGVFLNTCNSGTYQDWSARTVGGTNVTLVNAGTQRCLDANIHQGVFLNTCNGGSYQEWDTRAIAGTTVALVNVATQRCLDANIQQGVFLNTCNGGSYQHWHVEGSWAYCLVNCSPPVIPPALTPPPVRRATPLPRRRRAHVSLRGTPRSLRNGQAVRLRGRVTGAGVPSGTVVLLEARVTRRHWITFGWARTQANGSFSLRYRFTRTTGRQIYLMRAVLPTQFGYRSRGSLSNIFRVKVAGPAT